MVQSLSRSNKGIALLIDLLASKLDVNTRDLVVYILKEQDIHEIPTELITSRLLLNPDPEIRLCVLDLLGSVLTGARSKDYFLVLLKMLSDEDLFVASRAGVMILNTCEQTVRDSLDLDSLSPDSWEYMYFANKHDEQSVIRAVIAMGQHHVKHAIFLQTALKDPSDTVRRASVITLLRIKSLAKQLALSILADPDPVIRCFAIKYLANNFMTAYNFYFVQACKDDDALLRCEALFSLAQHSLVACENLPIVCSSLHDDHPRVRFAAVFALNSIAELDNGTVGTLIQLLADNDANVRSEAASSLQNASEPTAAMHALLHLFLSEDIESVRSTASQALLSLATKLTGEESILNTIVDLSRHSMSDMRLLALKIVSFLKYPSVSCLQVIAQALSDPLPTIRLAAAEALEGCPHDESTLAYSAVNALRDSDERIRRAILRFIRSLRLPTTSIIQSALVNLLADVDAEVRLLTAQTLSHFSLNSKEAITALVVILLTHPNCEIRRLAAQTIPEFDQNVDIAIPALQFTLDNDADNGVTIVVSRVLEEITARKGKGKE